MFYQNTCTPSSSHNISWSQTNLYSLVIVKPHLKLPKLLILKSIAICYCLFWAVCIVTGWSIHSHPHWPGDTANHGQLCLLILSVCVSQQGWICYPIKICVYTTLKSYPIVAELASYPMQGIVHVPNIKNDNSLIKRVSTHCNHEVFLTLK